MTKYSITPTWNNEAKSLDLMLSEEGFNQLGLYAILSQDGQMLQGVLGCHNCKMMNEANEQMPESQVPTPWFLGRMSNDPVLVRCKCELLRQWVVLGGGKGKKPPCLCLLELVKANKIPGLSNLPESSVVVISSIAGEG